MRDVDAHVAPFFVGFLLVLGSMFCLSWAQETATLKSANFVGKDLQLLLSKAVEIDEHFLPGNTASKRPAKYYIDLSPAHLSKGIGSIAIPKRSIVQKIRIAQNTTEKIRVVLELPAGTKASSVALDVQNEKLLLALTGSSSPSIEEVIAAHVEEDAPSKPVTKAKPAATKSTASNPTISKTVPSKKAKRSKKSDSATAKAKPASKKRYRIIVDAGHGGDDTGARGPTGTFEKTVTLRVAKKLKKMLEKNPRYEVFMTRTSDKTLELLDRTSFANKLKGDLFVSVHANASTKRTAKGVSTYFLHNADDEHSLRVAMRENGELDIKKKAPSAKHSDEYFLDVMKASMAKSFHTAQSTDLARSIQREMVRKLRGSYSGVEDLGVRSARFYVLTGVNMPSVLVETSFISNRLEEKRLMNDRYQEKLSQAMYDGISSYVRAIEKRPSHAAVYQ